jgi:hypothetical protein
VPVGVVFPAAGVTVAVNVISWLVTAGFTEDPSVVVVFTLLIGPAKAREEVKTREDRRERI